jgi:sn-glycerol 3-phosphate transport system substrate-binding protein
VAAPLPAHRRAAVPTGGTHFIVLKGARDEEKHAAWAFLRWMLEPDPVTEWATSTGYMPVTRSAIETLERNGYYSRSPNDRVAVEQLSVALPWPWAPELFRIQREVVQPRLEQAVLEQLDPGRVMDAARQAARSASG